MERWKGWTKLPYGKQLRKLHAWNAWVILLLTVTGLILYVPSIRGDLGIVRVWLKQLHIGLGLLSVLLLLLYVPVMRKHALQLRGKLVQQSNLAVVVVLLIGWSISGIVLWQFRRLPLSWSNTALLLHDLFTWVGVPYAIYHSLSRSRWLKREAAADRKRLQVIRDSMTTPAASVAASKSIRQLDPPWYMSRRNFIRVAAAAVMVAIVGPAFYNWLRRVRDTGGGSLSTIVESDGNRMSPLPEPALESLKPLGGGAAGEFRIYTVTELPVFYSNSWDLTIKGLVEKPMTLTWEQFLKIPRKVQVSDFHCVTGWSVYHCTWEGIPLSQLLEMAGVKSTAKFVKFYSGDDEYTDCLSLEQARTEDVMVVVMLDGKLIPQKLGGPVRLIVPKMYAYKSVKWLTGIELIEKEHRGYWEQRGYDVDGWLGRSNL